MIRQVWLTNHFIAIGSGSGLLVIFFLTGQTEIFVEHLVDDNLFFQGSFEMSAELLEINAQIPDFLTKFQLFEEGHHVLHLLQRQLQLPHVLTINVRARLGQLGCLVQRVEKFCDGHNLKLELSLNHADTFQKRKRVFRRVVFPLKAKRAHQFISFNA